MLGARITSAPGVLPGRAVYRRSWSCLSD